MLLIKYNLFKPLPLDNWWVSEWAKNLMYKYIKKKKNLCLPFDLWSLECTKTQSPHHLIQHEKSKKLLRENQCCQELILVGFFLLR